MEKFYQDYAYNLKLAVQWFQQIGKDKKAEQYWSAHLKIADNIRQEFNRRYRA